MLFGKLGVSLKVSVTKCASLPCGETSQVDYRPEAPRPEMGWGEHVVDFWACLPTAGFI